MPGKLTPQVTEWKADKTLNNFRKLRSTKVAKYPSK